MHVCLVRPPALTNTGLKGQIPAPPLGLAYIAASLRQAGHRVTVVDAVGSAPLEYRPVPRVRNAVLQGLTYAQVADRVPDDADLVGVSCMFSVEWPYDREQIRELHARRPERPLVVGGEHVTACPEYVINGCAELTAAVVGEGEQTAIALCSALEQGQDLSQVEGLCLRRDGQASCTPRRARIMDVDNIPAPDWSLFDMAAYIDNDLTWGVNLGTSMPILASRGCPYRCSFCSSENMWTTKWRPRDPHLVLAEMKRYMREYGARSFNFYDLTPIVSRRWIVTFTEALLAEDLGITWQMSSGTRSESIDDQVARLLHRSGCRNLNLAPETGSERLLELYHKQVNLKRLMAAVRSASRAGLRVKTNIIFGFPDETLWDALRTFPVVLRLALAGAHDMGAFFYVLIPGSEIFYRLEREGKVQLDDAFIHKLLAFTDPANGICFTEHFTSRQLGLLTNSSMALFYGLSYAVRPWRVLDSLRNLAQRTSGTKLEKQVQHAKRKQDAVLAHDQGANHGPRLLRELRSWAGVILGAHGVQTSDSAPQGL